MIIELFGAPASGKSTLAKALHAALQEDGLSVRLNASARPAEKKSTAWGSASINGPSSFSVTAPLSRAGKIASAVKGLVSGDLKSEVGDQLLTLLPPQKWVSRVRLQRYLSILEQSHKSGRAYNGITLIDQGYVTALCSLGVRAKQFDPLNLIKGLRLIPRPDLLIYVDTPNEILRARLNKRLDRLSAFERLFEQDIQANSKQVEMVQRVAILLQDHRWPTVSVSWSDRDGLEAAVNKILLKITAQQEAA